MANRKEGVFEKNIITQELEDIILVMETKNSSASSCDVNIAKAVLDTEDFTTNKFHRIHSSTPNKNSFSLPSSSS